MSKKSRQNKIDRGQVAERNAPLLTLGIGAKPYKAETIAFIATLVPGVEIVQPLGLPKETDKDRLSRARAQARYHNRAFGAIVRIEAMVTKYWRELVIGVAHELHVMHTHTIDETGITNPYGTVIVVFKPGHKDRIENGLCPIYWELA